MYTETASVQSTVAEAPVSLSLLYKTVTTSHTGSTDGSGNAAITFNIGRPTSGFTVDVVVDVGSGTASCSSSFTPL